MRTTALYSYFNESGITAHLLLNSKADVMKWWAQSLYSSSVEGQKSTVQLLLNNGASVLLTTNGTSPLYVACQNGHAKIVQLLINQGGEVNTYTNDRGCPLFVARLNDHKSIVQILLHNGA